MLRTRRIVTDWRAEEAESHNMQAGETHATQEETPMPQATTEGQETVDKCWRISNAAPQGHPVTMIEQRSIQLHTGSAIQMPQSHDMHEVYIQVRCNDLSRVAHVEVLPDRIVEPLTVR